ncbi:MAG: sigma-70 family RNA polymerase sigma factor [Ruminococcaceae bacterium]|nr:sigma-70 family RNA polymerase sigma factor [Oscillospiraceae bacterium]
MHCIVRRRRKKNPKKDLVSVMDKQKVDKIICDYLQKIYGFSVKKAFSYDEAEELCSNIVEEVYISLLKADDVVNIEGYIWRISEYTYSRYVSLKKRHSGISIDGMEIPFEEEFLPEDSEEEIARLRREIAFLTQTRRKIVYLFYYENKSISAISKLLNIPEGTVKWHLNKARNELKECFSMERKIGNLGLSPVEATSWSHDGTPGKKGGPEAYLRDKLNLNIVYSVYFAPKTKEEIAVELGVTPVYIEDKIDYLEGNGFLVRQKGNKYTTNVLFYSTVFSLERYEKIAKMKLEIADILVKEYVPLVRKAVSQFNDIYIPDGNRELFEAAAIFYGVSNNCSPYIEKDRSKYYIKTTDGGYYIPCIHLKTTRIDPEYKATLDLPEYWACGNMTRSSAKYPATSWAIDTRYSSREGGWANNLYTDYEYVYEFMTGLISDTSANSEKFDRLRSRKFISDDNKVNIMIYKGLYNDFVKSIPCLDKKIKDKFADFALKAAMENARDYPPQVQDLIVSDGVNGFVSRDVALMVLDILYENGTFKPLSENEKVTSNLIMFSDRLPK